MHLAILVTNTDLSDFAHQHPFDDAKFTAMVQAVRPDWRCTGFDCHKGEFPENLEAFDGVIITGSPASVHDDEPWVAQLQALIRQIVDAAIPVYGACYGHQAVALALGGEVGPNPHGWTFGLVRSEVEAPRPWMAPIGEGHRQYAAHKEQVTVLPPGAETVTSAPGVPCCGFVIGNRVYTSQNHPEMTPEFFTALLEEYSDALGPEVAGDARASLQHGADNRAYAETIARFFEQGVS